MCIIYNNFCFCSQIQDNIDYMPVISTVSSIIKLVGKCRLFFIGEKSIADNRY
jgi:hypothetical protein